MRLAVLAIIAAATAATVTGSTAEGADHVAVATSHASPTTHLVATASRGEAATSRYQRYAQCRRHRGYPVDDQTPSRRQLAACRAQRARDALVDANVAIRMTMPRPQWDAWIVCVAPGEGGRWRSQWRTGRAGEDGWAQIHPIHGANHSRLDTDALYTARWARRVWLARQASTGDGWEAWIGSVSRCKTRGTWPL